MLIIFTLLAYKFFLDRLVREKQLQYENELKHQKQLALESTKTQEEERKRIAILVHDDLGNRLNILSLWINNLTPENKDEVEKIISKQITELIDSARTISHSLYPVNLERLGLILYTQELISNLSKSIKITFDVDPNYEKKDIFIEVQLYRVIQEFTSNVIKHSNASQVSIKLREGKNYIAMTLFDNGQGFDYEKAKKGMGLKNITARVETINGKHKWKSKIGNGTKLIIVVPKSK